jgi:hypothetical protein
LRPKSGCPADRAAEIDQFEGRNFCRPVLCSDLCSVQGSDMSDNIEEGFMVFIADGQDGIGAVREVNSTSIVIYVENAGEFVVPRSAVKDVHFQKVILRPDRLDKRLLTAIGHEHDSEDPNLVG